MAPFDLGATAFAKPLGKTGLYAGSSLLSDNSLPFGLAEVKAPRADRCSAMREQGE